MSDLILQPVHYEDLGTKGLELIIQEPNGEEHIFALTNRLMIADLINKLKGYLEEGDTE